jgi:dynein heavy chain
MRFIANLDNVVNYLNSAHHHTTNIVYLAPGPSQAIQESIDAPGKQKEMASKSDQLKIIEDLVSSVWCKQMEQVLAESEQMRKEADDTGPIAELEHWRNLSARFNFLIEQIKSPRIKHCILV